MAEFASPGTRTTIRPQKQPLIDLNHSIERIEFAGGRIERPPSCTHLDRRSLAVVEHVNQPAEGGVTASASPALGNGYL